MQPTSETDIHNGVWFDGVECGDFAWFDEITFVNHVRFPGAYFEGLAYFGNTTFRGMAWFGRTEFVGGVSFSGSSFVPGENRYSRLDLEGAMVPNADMVESLPSGWSLKAASGWGEPITIVAAPSEVADAAAPAVGD